MKKNILLFAVACLITSSCNEDVLNTTNPNALTSDSYYNTVPQLQTAVNGVYAMLQSVNLTGREFFFLHDLRSDDVSTGGGQLETARNQVLIGAHTSTNAILGPVFNTLFKVIFRANGVITNGPNIDDVSDAALQARLIAEAKFLRAWSYYELGGFFGGVPIYDTYATSFDDAKPRSTQDEVFDFAIADLMAAKDNLPPSYSGNDLGRVTKGAAEAMLGKIYIFRGDYANAKTHLEAVKALGYSLTDEYFDNFSEETEYNSESVFEISFTSAGNFGWDGDGNDYGPNESWIRSQEYSAVGWRNLIPSDKLLAAFEVNDPRLNSCFYFLGDTYGDPAAPKTLTDLGVQGNTSNFRGSTTKVSWKKYSMMYKLDPGGYYDKIGINYRVIRYADILLMLAECENEVGNATNAVAYLNQIRNRASVSMPNYPTAAYPTGSKAEITAAIQHERQVELAGEEIRNFDILRWRRNGKLTSEPISYFQANKYELLPIPQDEINNNANINQEDQNPGY